MKVLYVAGAGVPEDGAAIRELSTLEPSLDIRPVEGASAALGEVRSDDQYQAVFLSPELPHNEALALIASLRRDRVPVAVVAIVTTEHRHFFAQALTGGADDVLTLGDTGLISVEDTLRRIRHSRHVEPGDHSRLRVLYAGHDELAWGILCELPFAHTEQTTCAADGSCSLRMSDQGDEGLPCDALVVDENPGDAHSLQVVKWVKSRHPDLPVIVLTAPTAGDVGGAALELGADDVVGKAGTYRRRLVATLYRLFFRRVLSRTAETVPALTPAPLRVPELAEVVGGLPWPEDRPALTPWGAEAPQGPDPAERDRLTNALRLAESRIDQFAEDAASARDALDALRDQHSREIEALQIERALRDRERAAEFAALSAPGGASDAERMRLADALRQAEARIDALTQDWQAARDAVDVCQQQQRLVADAELVRRAEHDRQHAELAGLVKRNATLAADAAAAANTLAALQQQHAQLLEAQAFDRALRDRDRTELTSVKHALTEERERRIVLEETLRHTEDRAESQLNALETQRSEQHRAELDELQRALAEERERRTTLERAAHQAEERPEEHPGTAHALGGYARMSLDGAILECNRSFAKMFGYRSAADLLEHSMSVPFAGLPDHPRVRQLLEAGESLEHAESTARRTDGRPFRVLTSAVLVPPAGESAACLERWCVDVSDRTRLEDQLRLTRRLESAGRLAAEMSPEIEAGLPSLAGSATGDSTDAGRVVTLVRQLLAFSRRQARPAGFISLNDAVSRSAGLLRQIAGEAITLGIVPGDVDPVAAGEDDLEQLLAEVTFAMAGCLPYGGSLTLETAPVASDLVIRTQLTATVAGYGVHDLSVSPSLTRTITRCGGSVHTGGDAGRTSTLHVIFPS